MTILVNNVLRIGTLPDIIYIAKPNTVFPRRMSHTRASVQDNARIAVTMDRVLQQPGQAAALRAWWDAMISGWQGLVDAIEHHQPVTAWRALDLYVADSDLVNRAMRETRARVVAAATAKIGSAAWSYAATNGVFGPSSNKWMLFVHDMVAVAGADTGLPHGWRHPSPPTAGDWATSGVGIPGWRPIDASETAAPGDVVAQAGNYSDATGHVMTVGSFGGNGQVTFIGTSDAAGVDPPGAVVQIPAKTNIVDATAVKGPELFRRWDPLV